MAFLKKSLKSILSTFQKAYDDINQWEELAASEQKHHEERLQCIKADRLQAQNARDKLKDILGL